MREGETKEGAGGREGAVGKETGGVFWLTDSLAHAQYMVGIQKKLD